MTDYFYVSMGGRLMEDFKLVHSRFGIRSMISIEMNETAYQRQVFNKPFAEIHCHQIPSMPSSITSTVTRGTTSIETPSCGSTTPWPTSEANNWANWVNAQQIEGLRRG